MIFVYFILSLLIGLSLFVNRVKWVKYSLLIIFQILQFLVAIYSFEHIGESYIFFTIDELSVLMLSVLALIGSASIWHSFAYINWRKKESREHNLYFSALVFLITAISGAYLSGHIAITWVFVEITTLSASFLIYYRRTDLTLEGTWKYIFVCSISISFVFIGILFLSIAAMSAGITDLSFSSLKLNSSRLDSFWTRMAFLFIFTGFTAKAGLFPMYTAGIDAKDKSPAPAGAIFSSALMNVGFVGIFRIYSVVYHSPVRAWADSLLAASALLSIFVAAVYMLKVNNYKRMLAYSSLEHMGIVILGMTCGTAGIFAALFHLTLHSFAKAGMFFQLGIAYRLFNSKLVEETGGYIKIYPAGAITLMIGYFCVTAVPPSGLFITEFMIFSSMYESGKIWFLSAALLLISIIIWVLGRNLFKLLFTPRSVEAAEIFQRAHPAESFSQILLFALVIYAGIAPPEILVKLLRGSVALITR